MRAFRQSSLLVFLTCAAGVALAQNGLIRGTLLDSNRNPVAKADVFAMSYLHCDLSNQTVRAKIESGEQDKCLSMWDGRVDATTDEAGIFELEQLQSGVYELWAQKPQDRYCATFQEPVIVVLSPVSPYSQIIFHLPPKCALLTGNVRNAKTDKLVSDVTLRMRPKDADYCEIAGAFVPMSVQIPSQREFTLEVLAEGFEVWAYRSGPDENPAGNALPTPLNLQAGETLNLDIALNPLPKLAKRSPGIDCPVHRSGQEKEQNK